MKYDYNEDVCALKREGVMLVGLCGRSGSGKGYVSALFQKEGIPSVDTDAVYREMTSASDVVSECMVELVERFGTCVINPDNSLNRVAMRSLVFGDDKQALSDLNSITHKHILKKTEEIAEYYFESGYGVVLVDAPLLYESGFDKKCRCVISVTAPEDTIIERIIRRDGISREDAEKRLKTQLSATELLEKADFVIHNDCEKDELINRVRACARELFAIRNREYN
ncbi:MAG: dephospho-CoA kinase [Ruminococcaceae bacterium]|nr:dephospho-CoA kinase [Oscillospiraceae bacterium]